MEEQQLRNLFIKQAKGHVKIISTFLKTLQKNPQDQKALKGISVAAHSLEGDALLAEEYLLAYLASKIDVIITKIIYGKVVLDKEKLGYLWDFHGSLQKTLQAIVGKGKSSVNVDLLRRIEESLSTTYKKKEVFE